MMRTPRELIATCENWNAREVSRRALTNAKTEEQRQVLRGALDRTGDVDPLDVVRDVTELVELLNGWRRQAVWVCRMNGASWAELGAAMHMDGIRTQLTYSAD